MRKIILLASIIVLSMEGNSQNWNKTLTATNLSTGIRYLPVIGSNNTVPVGMFEIKQDAVDVNINNSNSKYPLGSVFSIYSIGDPATMINPVFPISQLNSAWIKIMDQKGRVLHSKAIKIPSSFNYAATPLSQRNATRQMLTINSVRYNNNDLIVFTGNIQGYFYTTNQTVQSTYKTMIVGTYNLQTENVEIEYINNPTKTVCNASGNCQTYHVNSSGIGINYMSNTDYYQAIGVTMNYTNNSLDMQNPVAFVFDVDPVGRITVIQKEAFNFIYRPSDVDHYLNPYSTITTGLFAPDQSISTNCSNIPQAFNGLGVVEFKFQDVYNETRIGEFTTIYSKDFSENRSSNNDFGTPVIFHDNENQTFVAFDAYPAMAVDYPVIGKLSSGLSNTEFYKIEVQGGVGIEVEAFQFTEKDRFVELSLGIYDAGNFNQDNYHSMGLINLNKSDFGNPSRPITQLYSHDNQTDNIRNFGSITSIGILDQEMGVFDYYIADGIGNITDKSRAHIYGVEDQNFDGLCNEILDAEINVICYEEDHYRENDPYWDVLNNSRYLIGNTSNFRNATVERVYGDEYNCDRYDNSLGSFRLKNQQEKKELISSTKIYPNPSNGFYSIELNTDQFTQFKIHNVLGELVIDQNIVNTDAAIQTLDISSQPNGIYFVTLLGANEQEVVRIIKQ